MVGLGDGIASRGAHLAEIIETNRNAGRRSVGTVGRESWIDVRGALRGLHERELVTGILDGGPVDRALIVRDIDTGLKHRRRGRHPEADAYDRECSEFRSLPE